MSDKMKQRYEPLLECQPLEAGDAVWLHHSARKKGLSPKLQRPWQGPYIVIKHINDLVYRIKLGPKAKPKVVHRNRLWKYTGENIPTWYMASDRVRSISPRRVRSVSPTNSELQTGMPNETQSSRSLRQSDRSRHPPSRYGT